jgi:hypothetical protein
MSKRKTLTDEMRERDAATDRNGQNSSTSSTAGPKPAPPEPPTAAEWDEPLPLDTGPAVPDFPTDLLPAWMREWVRAEAEATQTPPDLAGMLALAIAGAALAKKFRVQVRDAWAEPTNLFAVVALPPGDRKSAVFADAIRPVEQYEREEVGRTATVIAEAAAERRILEARLKQAEANAAKETNPEKRQQLRDQAKSLARELARNVVPDPPQLLCDDETPEDLARLLARHGGRMLQASAEGTAFEIAKGRYSETANFDVYLKGHAGDALRVGRLSRETDTAEQPALSVALAVQPDVIRGLAEQATMRGRGFLARFLYSLPRSRVGGRRVAPAAVPAPIATTYHTGMLSLWRTTGTVDEAGGPSPRWLRFGPEAEQAMRAFELWLEPQLREGEPLSYLAGWANKLAGAAARIAGILHVAAAFESGLSWDAPVAEETASAAISLARYYLLPHAQAAFGLMGDDPVAEDARRVIRWLQERNSVNSVDCVNGGPLSTVSKRDLHANVFGSRRTVEEVDHVIGFLVKHLYLRPSPTSARGGPGRRPSPTFEVNPSLASAGQGDGPRSQNSQNSQNGTPQGDAGEGG